MSEEGALVIDVGSSMCKAGFAGDDAPRSVFSAVVGRPPLMYPTMVGTGIKDFYIGDEAQERRGLLDLSYPVKRGIVQNWEDMEKVWHHVFYNELRVDPTQFSVLSTDAPMNPKTNRERMCETMFETFGVPRFFVQLQAILALYGSGRGVGLVIDSGDGITHMVPVYQGYTLPHAIQRMDLAGMDVTLHLAKLLAERGYSFTTKSELEIVKSMKEHLCFVSEDVSNDKTISDSSSALEQSYELPDGNRVTLGPERFMASEVLFQPSLIGNDSAGLHEVLHQCIKACDLDLRRDFYTNILLSGGNTLLPGFRPRLEKEFKCLSPPSVNVVRVVDAPERKYLVWIGGSILASLSTFQDMWITKKDYEEEGPYVVHKKCVL